VNLEATGITGKEEKQFNSKPVQKPVEVKPKEPAKPTRADKDSKATSGEIRAVTPQK
jgi:hypothetical protein